MSHAQPIIAVLDDEPKMRKALRRLLSAHGFRVMDYGRGEHLLQALSSHPADCLVLDLHMPEMSGFDVLDNLTARHMTMPVVVITGHDGPGMRDRTLAVGAAAFLRKPVDESALLGAIHAAIEHATSMAR